ncbi:MAG: acetate kinase [Phycisphaerales bacterium]|nr:acetate kinase [Phycisphaerales bacterium]
MTSPSNPTDSHPAPTQPPRASASAACVLAINGGSSSIKFAVYAAGDPPTRKLLGQVERIGQDGAALSAKDAAGNVIDQRPLEAAHHAAAADALIDWLRQHLDGATVTAIGHRVVHGGVRLSEHQRITDEVLAELRAAAPVDLAHLPREIALIEVFGRGFPGVPQVACLDTAFHRDLPRVAELLPIPRKFFEAGIRRLGFHGLSYAYLMEELGSIAPREASGRVILAHLGSGASMAAVRDGKSVDTTMAFTPTAGLVMGTRPGDLDPGLLIYLMREQNLTPEQMDEFLSKRCGLIGLSETSADMRDLIARRDTDRRAAEAVEVFCYQAKKWIGAYAAVMGGLDAVVFSGGIGEHSPEVRAETCAGLEFLGLRIDAGRNKAGAAVISRDESKVAVRVIATDEESMIARITERVVGTPTD